MRTATSEKAYRLWEPTPLAGRGGAGATGGTEAEARRRKAAEDGYQAGLRAGTAAAQATAQRLAALLASAENGARLVEERLAGELLDVAVDLARHIVRAEVTVRREAVLPVVREALAMLSQEARSVQIIAHPADAELLRTHLADEVARGGWQVVEDHRIEPGGLRLHSSTGDVDATLATRWRRALAALGRDHAWHEAAE